MQKIYVDVLIFLNVFITYFLLLGVKRLLRLKTSTKRLILSSLAGGIFSLLALLPELTIVLSILYKLSVASVLVLIAFEKCRIKEFAKRTFTFFVVSFLFCGIMIMLYSLLKPNNLVIINDVVYFHISPLFLLSSTVICYLILRIYQHITRRRNALHHIYSVTVFLKSKSVTFDGRIDTGCSLTEPFSGADVIIAEKSVLKRLAYDENNMRVIPFSSLGGSGIIKGFRADDVYINNIRIEKEIYIGACENIIVGEVKAIINSNIIESEENLCVELKTG